MTHISPTALEAAAKAFEQDLSRDMAVWVERYTGPHGCDDDAPEPPKGNYRSTPTRLATAAITAYLAQAGKEGWVMVRGVSTCNIESLRPIESDLLNKLMQGVNIASSDRASCGARTRLKKLGLIAFDRKTWRWVITDAGRAMLAAAQNGGEPCK